MIDPNDKKDFQDFMNSKGVNPPEELSNRILSFVQADLNPAHKVVFSKLLAIQAFIGFLTLTFCPQFNLSLTNTVIAIHLVFQLRKKTDFFTIFIISLEKIFVWQYAVLFLWVVALFLQPIF